MSNTESFEEKVSDKKKKIVAIAIIILLLLIGISVLVFSLGKNDVQKYLDLGNKYLEEMKYDDALAAFNQAIEIDDKCVEAYLGVVEVYIRTEEFDKALDEAKLGYEKTGDERLKEKIDMLESGNIVSSDGMPYRTSHYDENGIIIWYLEYTYDEKRRPATVTHCSPDGTVLETLQLEYDEDGNQIVSYGTFSETGVIIRMENTYKNGHIITSKHIPLDGSDVSLYENTYDGDLLVQEKISIQRDDYTQVTYYLNEYNSKKQQTKRTYCDENMQVMGYDTFEYKDGNMSRQNMYHKNSDTGEFELSSYNINKFDSDGNYLGHESYDGDGNLQYSDLSE